MAVRELTKNEEQFKKDMELKYPGFYDFTPFIVGFLKQDTRNAYAGYCLALEVFGFDLL